MPGPAPQPTVLKLLRGNPGKQDLNAAQPVPPAIPIGKPDWLSDVASAEWDRIAPQLAKMRILTDVDTMPLAAYCEAVARFIEATELLNAQGPMLLTYRGGYVKNPVAQLARDALADLTRTAVEFGLTPSSRSRVKVPDGGDPVNPDDPHGILS